MALPPPALLPFLARHPGEVFVGATLTADVHTFAPATLDAPTREAPVWLAATQQRLWACAWDEVQEKAWAVAVGRPDQVSLSAGWQRDELKLGAYTVRLRRGSRKEVAALVDRWVNRRPAGDPWPLQVPMPPAAVPRARGAAALPHAVWVGAVDPGERWLAAVETDGTWPVHSESGPGTVPLLVACTDRRTLVVPAMPAGGPGPVFPVPSGPLPTDGRAWAIGGRTLRPRGPKEQTELVDAMAAVADPGERWGLAARQALISGTPKRTLSLINESFRLGLAQRSWPHLVQLALAMDQGPIAVAAAWQALNDDPDLDVVALVRLTLREAPAVAKVVRQSGLTWAGVRRLAARALDSLATMPTAPDLLPWPPTTVRTGWATALALHGRWQLAARLFAKAESGPDRDRALAVCASVANRPAAPERWRAAALSARAAGRDAYRLLSQATELQEQARDRWLWGWWCWTDGRVEEAKAQWRRAMALHESGAFTHLLDLDGLSVLARVALSAGRPHLAAQALRRAIGQDPGRLDVRRELAAVLAEPVGRPMEAADALVEAADAMDHALIADDDGEPRWRLWVDAAELRRRAGHPDEALLALREALAGDFLALDAWKAVLEAKVERPESLRYWWSHIHRILAGEAADAGRPLPGHDGLADASLDALHPGGAGWLDGLRQQLGTTEAPGFAALTRGLDRLREARFNDTAAVVEDLSQRLELTTAPAGHVFRGQGSWGISAWPSTPPVLLIGGAHLREGDRHLSPGVLRYAVAAELVHLRCNHPVLTFDASWLGTSRSVYDQVNGWAGTAETIFDLVTLVPGLDQAKKVQTIVKLASTAFRTRGAVDKAVKLADPVTKWLGFGGAAQPRGLSREGLSGAALQFRVQAERAALLLTGDLQAAVEATLALSTNSAALVPRMRSEGLQALLADPEAGLAGDELFRLTALIEFATTQMPWTGIEPTDG